MQTEGAGRQPNGACLSYECQLGPLPRCQYSVLGVWVSSDRCHCALSESLPVSTIEWSRPCQPVPAQWPMPATVGAATTREGTGHGTGSFLDASVEKKSLQVVPRGKLS